MQYVIVIDGGGSKTVLKIADIQGKVIGTYEGGPCNINSKAFADVKAVLIGLIIATVRDKELLLEDCKGICIGTAGAGGESEKAIIEGIIRETGFKGKLIVTDDAVTALYGGCGRGGNSSVQPCKVSN